MQQELLNITLIYKFYFEGIPEPLPIEAWNKDLAYQQLNAWVSLMNITAPMIKQTVVRPLFGVTNKKMRGVLYLWCGKDKSITGWMEATNFFFQYGEVFTGR